MSEAFSSVELTQLMAFAMRHADRDSVRLAIRCTRAAGESLDAILVQALDLVPMDRSYLRAAFEWCARYGLLSAIESLANDPRPEVSYAIPFAVAEGRSVQHLLNIGRAPDDVESFDEQSKTPGLSLGELATVSVILAKPYVDQIDLARSLLNTQSRVLGDPASAMAAAGGLDLDSLLRAAEEAPNEPSGPFLVALASVDDPRAEHCLLDMATRFPSSRNVLMAMARMASPATIGRLIERLPHRRNDATEALKNVAVPRAVAPLLAAFSRPGHMRRMEARLVARVAGNSAILPLIDALNDNLRVVRDSATDALGAMGKSASIQLIPCLESTNATAHLHALRALGQIGDPGAADAIDKFITDHRSQARVVAIEAYIRVAGAEAEPRLRQLLRNHVEVPGVRVASALALRHCSSESAIAALGHAFGDGDAPLRQAVVGSLVHMAAKGARGSDALLNVLISVFVESGPDMRQRLARVVSDPGSWTSRQLQRVVSAWESGRGASLGSMDDLVLAELRNLQDRVRKREQQESRAISAEVSGYFTERYGKVSAERAGGHSFGAGVIRGGPAPPPPPPTTACPPNLGQSCYFSVVAPEQVALGTGFIVELWCHPEPPDRFLPMLQRYVGRAQQLRTRGPVQVKDGVTMDVELLLPGFALEDREGTMRWESRTGVIGFAVKALDSTASGTYLGTARILVAGIRVASVHFQIEVAADVGVVADQTSLVARIDSAFASYATEDRNQVLSRIQGMQKVLPTLDVFLDVLSLRSGDKWQQRINEEIQARDVFFLFWSRAARQSHWVDLEWRAALHAKGLDFIDPVPLEDAALAPPPAELSSRHFRDWTLALMKPS